MKISNGRSRVIIEQIAPQINCGKYPIKRVIGEDVAVEATIFADGHDTLSCELMYRHESATNWETVSMVLRDNDRWRATFHVTRQGTYNYTVRAWIDRFSTWVRDIVKKFEAGQHVAVDLLCGMDMVDEASMRTTGPDAVKLREVAGILADNSVPVDDRIALVAGDEVYSLMARTPDRKFAAEFDRTLSVTVDREKARFSTWYELFPRSLGSGGGHGTFRDCITHIPYVADMGFDVLYLPPIHPIGTTYRKGKDNAPSAGPDDPGSPWAIGGAEGGHDAIHPALGTLDDFNALVTAAASHNIELAIDLALQCSPDHPYVREHPEWFKKRPDGSIQYAENPPKKYEDIFPIDFETENWRELWEELRRVVRFWAEQGIRIIRVDNPHTKSFPFWEWLIGGMKHEYPDMIFLAEAFTRPTVMYHLAKVGFSQSYTYFTWRNTKWEIEDYITELTRTEVGEYFRPNLWPNTPDILPEFLQMGGRPAFIIRLVLAATLSGSYGIYGPAYELAENTPTAPGNEEYLHSEKYEIRDWDLNRTDSLRQFITELNRARHENAALQSHRNIIFHPVDNEKIICYSKHSDDMSNIILITVNLDPYHRHTGWVDIDLDRLNISRHQPYQMHDLLSHARFIWYGSRNFIELDPAVVPAHVFRIKRKSRTERDFDYFM